MAVILAYAVAFFRGVTLVGVCIPVLFVEIKSFLSHWPQYTEQMGVFLSGFDSYAQSFGLLFDKQSDLCRFEIPPRRGSVAFSTTLNLFRGSSISSAFLALIFARREGHREIFLMPTPDEYHTHALARFAHAGESESWLFGPGLAHAHRLRHLTMSVFSSSVPCARHRAFFGGLHGNHPISDRYWPVPAIIIGLLPPGLGLAALIFISSRIRRKRIFSPAGDETVGESESGRIDHLHSRRHRAWPAQSFWPYPTMVLSVVRISSKRSGLNVRLYSVCGEWGRADVFFRYGILNSHKEKADVPVLGKMRKRRIRKLINLYAVRNMQEIRNAVHRCDAYRQSG